MESLSEESLNILSGRTDHTRIVRPQVPKSITQLKEGVAAQAPAHLNYMGGPLLEAVEVFTIFWGQKWEQDQDIPRDHINKFFQDIVKSSLIDQISEYSVQEMDYNISHGKFLGTTTITQPTPTPNVTDGAIQHILKQEIATNTNIPKPNINTLYFLYLQKGVRVSAFGDSSCNGFCGYHDHIPGTQIYYAVMPYPSCDGCIGGLEPKQALTSTSSHELIEAITDPIPGQGWYDQNFGEIGDICSWETKEVDGYTVQLEWSNTKKSCI